jgi:hypothetical protein
VRVARAAAIADADVQVAVRTEGDIAAVVIALRVVDVEQLELGARGQGRAVVGGAELGDAVHQPQRGIGGRVVEVDARIGRVVGMKRHAQQAAFVVGTGRIGVQF